MKLTAAKRRALPDSAFAVPEKREYPLTDPQHVALAKGRLEQFGSRLTKKQEANARKRIAKAEAHMAKKASKKASTKASKKASKKATKKTSTRRGGTLSSLIRKAHSAEVEAVRTRHVQAIGSLHEAVKELRAGMAAEYRAVLAEHRRSR
jgi:FKBP-type peptidyl-prolyl cis-trans isomerase